MMKKVFSAMIVAMSLMAVPSFAQTADNAKCADSKCKSEKVAKCKAECEKVAKCSKGAAGKMQAKKARNEFEGLTLTDSQKQQLSDLQQKRMDARKVEREQMKAQRQQMKAEKSSRDSLRVAKRTADRKEYLEEVKTIIGPDQYIVFLENQYINAAPMQKSAKMGHQAMKGKDFKANKDQKGQKGDKGQKGQKGVERQSNQRQHAAR